MRLKHFSIAILMAIFVLMFVATGSEAMAQATSKSTTATKMVKQCRLVRVPVKSKRTGKTTRRVQRCKCITTAANANRAKQLDEREAVLNTKSGDLDKRETVVTKREGDASDLEKRLAALEQKISDRETAVTTREIAVTTAEKNVTGREADLNYWWSWLPYVIAGLVMLFILAIVLANYAGRRSVRRRYEEEDEANLNPIPRTPVNQTRTVHSEDIMDETEQDREFGSGRRPITES